MIFNIEPIAYIENDYIDKFGIPRQSGLENNTLSKIIFEEKYRDKNALRGLDGYSHIWLLWIFSKTQSSKEWSPTVRPPRLGGNKRMGVFSTRSPYHPNKIGLSCVKIEAIENTKDVGTVITVSGADLMHNTPIIDIKPYLAFSDSIPNARCGFAEDAFEHNLEVAFEADVSDVPTAKLSALTDILSQDPRPSYQNDSDRIYSMDYSEYKIKFKVNNKLLSVIEILKKMNGSEK